MVDKEYRNQKSFLFYGKPIRLAPIKFWIDTDASHNGMGAVFGDKNFSKCWTKTETNFHINYLELLAIYLLLNFF